MYQKLLWKIESLWSDYQRNPSWCVIAGERTVSQMIKDTFFSIDSYPASSSPTDSSPANSSTTDGSFGFSLVSNFDFTPSINSVFSDDYGSYFGIAKSQVVLQDSKLVYLFDNHQKFLVPLFHLYQVLGRPVRVLHIDAHPDDALYQYEYPLSLDAVTLHNLLQNTRISDFFDAVSKTDVIAELTRITTSSGFADYSKANYDIVSLDIDIFGPEGDFTELERKIPVIADAWQSCPVISIATSPGFIDQKYAQEIIKILTS